MAGAILVTGGAGFIGSSLATAFRRLYPATRVVALDNLRRRGSELNLPRLAAAGVEFRRGDVRVAADLAPFAAGLDVIVECSADPSVMAGRDGDPRYVIDTNLGGCVNCLELARTTGAAFVFLSTSRVYPTGALARLRYETSDTRFTLTDDQIVTGASARGISESFPLDGARTLYGATKLAAELLIAEYADMFGVRAIVNRCGVIAGPWQMGREDQGLVAHWMLAHVLRRPLDYIGFGGRGQQVRDVLHVDDLVDLLAAQLDRRDAWTGDVFNVGGGPANAVSLVELTRLCEAASGVHLDIGSRPETRPGDVPLYVTDISRVRERFGWQPARTLDDVGRDVHGWIAGHAAALAGSVA